MKRERMFLRVRGRDIVNEQRAKVFLRGLNLGGWLMMEGYILGGRNIPETLFKEELERRWGSKVKEEFVYRFRKNFIQKKDIAIIRNMGFNVVRLPFHYKLVESRPGRYSSKGLFWLDEALRWAEEYGIYIILDLHAAVGSQNRDWHSDSQGKALLWEKREYQVRTVGLWEFLADRYRERAVVAGYDILNEPVTEDRKLLRLYREIIRAVRRVDKRHILFLEGNFFGQHLNLFNPDWDDNSVYSIHAYQPLNFTFNFSRGLSYPGLIDGRRWDRKRLNHGLLPYITFQRKHSVPLFVGEFGVNSRCPCCHSEYEWVKDMLELFREFGVHWTYWTYKAVAGGIYPDGLYRLEENRKWLKRENVHFGWEGLWYDYRNLSRDFFRSMDTGQFTKQQLLARLLKKYRRE